MINKELSNFQKFRYSEAYSLTGNGTLIVIALLIAIHLLGVINGLVGAGTGMGGLLFLLLDALIILGFAIVSISLIVSTLLNSKKHPTKPRNVSLITDIGFIIYVILIISIIAFFVNF